MVADTLSQEAQGVIAVAQVTQHPGLLFCARLGGFLETPQLRLKVADGLLEVAEVHPGDAHVAKGLGLPDRVLELPGPLELLLEAPEGQGVVAEAHVDRPEVAVGPALPAGVSNVLENREFLKSNILLPRALAIIRFLKCKWVIIILNVVRKDGWMVAVILNACLGLISKGQNSLRQNKVL